MNVVAYVRQNNVFVSAITPFSPISTPAELAMALNILASELKQSVWNGFQQSTIKILLDEIDFPFEFLLLRSVRSATFTIYFEGKGIFWIESVQATLTNILSDKTLKYFNYKIEIPENYKTLSIVSNVDIYTSSLHPVVLVFKMWHEN